MSVESDRLKKAVLEDRVIRGKWTQGHERACLLATMVPVTGVMESAGACPASVMPQWMAQVTPLIDDCGTWATWPGVINRYADLAGRWHVLGEAGWELARVAIQHRLSIRFHLRPDAPVDTMYSVVASNAGTSSYECDAVNNIILGSLEEEIVKAEQEAAKLQADVRAITVPKLEDVVNPSGNPVGTQAKQTPLDCSREAVLASSG